MRKAPAPRECANTVVRHVAHIHGHGLCQPCAKHKKNHGGRPRSEGLILAQLLREKAKRAEKARAR